MISHMNMRWLLSEFLILLIIAVMLQSNPIQAQREADLIVSTDKGKVRGVNSYLSNQGAVVTGFLGIPFAKPPIGHLRFKHPQPMDQWEGIYNATSLPNSCYQDVDTFFGDFSGSTMWNPTTKVSEDCLYLNVWVPNVFPKLHEAAVLVWIFGGGFMSGTPTLDLYDGKTLAAHNNVIVVSIGYRVGALGFLSLDHPEAPGNAGMFDQLMGLDWIQRNIKQFGGDPNNVTIFGQSAGAVSVSLHLLSPLSQSKFQRAIMQSGVATAPWATLTKESAKDRALELAIKYLGCPKNGDMEEILYCLKQLPPQKITEEQWLTRGVLQFPFLPVIDGVFLVETPEISLKRKNFKRCPIIVGTNRDEGSYFLIYELSEYISLDKIQMNREHFLMSLDRLFYYYPQYLIRNTEAGQKVIAFQYSNWLDPSDERANAVQLSNAVGDGHFTSSVYQFAHAYASVGESVYYYYFTERYLSNPWPEWMGVLHGDDILFVFGEPLKQGLSFTRREKQLSSKVMTFWTNFAKSGDPNKDPSSDSHIEEWPLYGRPQDRNYLELNSKFLDEMNQTEAIGRGLKAKQSAFWLEYLPELLTLPDTIPDAIAGTAAISAHNNTCQANSSGEGVRSSIMYTSSLLIMQTFMYAVGQL